MSLSDPVDGRLLSLGGGRGNGVSCASNHASKSQALPRWRCAGAAETGVVRTYLRSALIPFYLPSWGRERRFCRKEVAYGPQAYRVWGCELIQWKV